SDRTSTKLGKRTPYILAGTAMAVILMNVLPILDNSYAAQPSPFKLASFIIVLALLLVAMGVYRSPAVALMPDVTPTPLRSGANAIISRAGTARAILCLATSAILYPTEKAAGLEHVDYPPLFLAVSAIMVAAIVVMLLTVREPKLAAENQALERRHPE